MNTGEFLSRLEDALRGEVSNQVIEANLQYYRDYITGEIRKGRTEEQVMDELGDPRLIARTIIETQGGTGAGSGRTSASGYRSRRRDPLTEARRKCAGFSPGRYIWF